MAIPPRLERVHGIRQLQDPDSRINMRIQLPDVLAAAPTAAVAADILPRLAGSYRSRAERDVPRVFDLLSEPTGSRGGISARSPHQIGSEAFRIGRAAPSYQGPLGASSPMIPRPGVGPSGTPMTEPREAQDLEHPMELALPVIQLPLRALVEDPSTPPRGADGRIRSEVLINRTQPNPHLG